MIYIYSTSISTQSTTKYSAIAILLVYKQAIVETNYSSFTKSKTKIKNKQTKNISADVVNKLLCSLAVEQYKFTITEGYTKIHLSFIENKSNYPLFACGYSQ